MKKIFFIIIIIAITFIMSEAKLIGDRSFISDIKIINVGFAEEASDSGSVKAAQIQELKSLLATRVAELRQGSKKVVSGEIKTITADETIILTTKTSEQTVVPTDKTTFLRVSLSGTKTITFANLVKGDYLTVFGNLDEISNLLNASVIIAQIQTTLVNGKVTEIDRDNGTITVKTLKNGSYIIDIEVNTKILTPDQKRYGYSKMKIGDRVFITGLTPTTVTNGENRLSAIRILDFPTTATPLPTPTATASAKPK